MSKLKATLVAAAGLAVGIVTLRAVRRRRATPRQEAETALEAALEETAEAAEHAAAAVGHARVAGRKAIEHARAEYEPASVTTESDEEPTFPTPTRRLRDAGKSWIRR